MFRTLDRYVLREVAMPFGIALVVFTFVLEIPPILREGEALVAQGVPLSTVARLLVTLLPQALSLTIPMAVLVGILVGFGRLAADREFVALQACGVSLTRLMRPLALVASVTTAATAYVTIVALPNANQTFREITFGVMATRVESNVRAGVFFQDFPNRVIYARSVLPTGGWRDVFLADTTAADRTTVYFASEGRVRLDRAKRVAQLLLVDGTSHTTSLSEPAAYEASAFDAIAITLDPETVFPRPPARGAPEMTFAELDVAIAEAASRNDPGYTYRFMAQQKLSLPATCPILALIGLALGASSRKDGKLASFVLGFGVIFVYYVLLWTARAFAHGGRLSPEWAPWVPNLIMAAAGVALLVWRARAADQPIRLSVPAFWRRRAAESDTAVPAEPARRPRVVVVLRVPHLGLPLPRVLDWYVSREYLRVLLLGVMSLLGIFYISTFIDLADKMFRGEATTATVLRYFYFQTPQYVYYIIPIAVLVAVLVTIGVMTKNSELLVMRACGVSLYRTAAPLVLFALAASATLYLMQEQVLAEANREADRLNRVIRRLAPRTSALDRRWVVGRAGEMYHYDLFDDAAGRFTRLRVFHVDERSWRLRAMDYASEVSHRESGSRWIARNGWTRRLAFVGHDPATEGVAYTPFDVRELAIEPPDYFKSETPESEQMTYGELREYITRLRASGAYVVPFMVALQRKVAFPFVTVIMTLLAIPFAVTTGRRGALYGIGIGIVLAIVYWTTLSLFAALGSGGVLPPALAAWAPNVLFGAAAAYMILTVRT